MKTNLAIVGSVVLLIGIVVYGAMNEPKPRTPIEDLEISFLYYNEDGDSVFQKLLVDTIYGDSSALVSEDTKVKLVSQKINPDGKTFNVKFYEHGEDTLLGFDSVPMEYYYKWKYLGMGKSPYNRTGK